ncbi:hypothetical protein GWI33_019321 [Rhynchophorus ferrugineus]|uniref:DUF4774 domain-containing protein n=1 Tax=Rhynchophorus ferrugineus TaxID=354439 RepID=A0A834HRY0_RHYFE|nr:hypothetical protein GWI33_019321 [Rhynchophorus ferrugineus]
MWSSKFLLIFLVSTVVARPQSQLENKAVTTESTVEIERHEVRELFPSEILDLAPGIIRETQSQKEIENNTQEILKKIAEVNRSQGLIKKKSNPTYLHFPTGFFKSHPDPDQEELRKKLKERVFVNPILEYLKQDNSEFKEGAAPSYREPEINNVENNQIITRTVANRNIGPDDEIPGQYIKRKVTHYQSILVPNTYMIPGAIPTNIPSMTDQRNTLFSQNGNMNIAELENNNNLTNENEINKERSDQSRQNLNWPGANLFPIFIRDPFLQMYYAVTNMIEYGPNAGSGGPCKLTPSKKKSTAPDSKDIVKSVPQIEVDISKKTGVGEVRSLGDDISSLIADMDYLDVENLDVGDEDKIKMTFNVPKAAKQESREFGEDTKEGIRLWEKVSQSSKEQAKDSHTPSGKLDFSSLIHRPIHSSTVIPSTNLNNLEIYEQDEDLAESEKADDIKVTNEKNRKLFSQDNAGNGIFIHKLRVRKGGVAIAGPGGIATAGSGGTAIVGPNGIAYTHPDGLAIAGSGTKVIAVDPKIDLNEAIKHSNLNGTKHVPNTRIGKVVAVGPVIYYNKGD